MNTAKIIVVTGYIGSGKTTVNNMFHEYYGVPVFFADQISRQAMGKGTEGHKDIVKEFGENPLYDNGEINRKHLASIVFKNIDKLKTLETIIHPLIISYFFREVAQHNGHVFFEVPPVMGLSLKKVEADQIILVTAPDFTKIERIIKRDYCSENDARLRMRYQKLPRDPDFVISNNGSLDDLKESVHSVAAELGLKQ